MKGIPKSKQPVSFDDALPERLLTVAPAEQPATKVPLCHDEVEPSRYIVKLTRDNDPGTDLSVQVEDPIAALARSFIIEHDDVLDEAPLMVASSGEDGLRLSRDDFKEQLSELELKHVPIIARPVKRASHATVNQLEPVDMWSDIQPIDVVEVFATARVNETLRIPASDISDSSDESVPSQVLAPIIQVKREAVYVRRGHGWQRALASFVGIAMASVLPLHAIQVLADARADGGAIEAESKAALNTFLRGATLLSHEDFGTAGEDFSVAAQGFAKAEASLDNLHAGITTLAQVIPQTDRSVETIRALVTAGRELSESAAVISSAAHELSDKDSIDLTSKLSLLGAYMETALPHAEAAAQALQVVDATVAPAEYSAAVLELQTRAPELVRAMGEYIGFVDALSVMLGGQDKMRYLAVFQNNTELRPTGGFMGSFAEMDVDRGEVVRMFVPGGGTYAVQGQLQAFVAAPGPLQLLKSRWEFQDANWFPDFPASAKKLRWFYSKAGGPTVDGVVAVNATFVAELLRVLGPVDMPEYGRVFNAENFIFETQKIVELEYDKTRNVPKEIIGDLAPILFERIQAADVQTLLAVVDLVAQGLAEKDIQVNFRDDNLQTAATSLGWSGSLKHTSGDYLMLVNTNLGGGKTDGIIDQDIQVDVSIASDGSVENTVTITKTHRGLKTALFTGSNNVDYLRLYVPEGSQLISADGFEIPDEQLFETTALPLEVDDDLALHMQDLEKHLSSGTDIWVEDGKTVFGNWMQTAPGETEIVHFKYRLPKTIFADPGNQSLVEELKRKLGSPALGSYSMLIQKQAGVQSRQTTVDVTLPPNMVSLWGSTVDASRLRFTTDNAIDGYTAWLIERH